MEATNAPLKELNNKIDSNLKEIEEMVPSDPIAKATGAKVGSQEHIAQSQLTNIVKETNSTRRVNRALRVLKWVGYVGLLIASIIKFVGIVYDINFHVPFLSTVIGEVGIATLGFFIAVVIIIMTHVTSDGVVNNKWKAVPRLILIWLAMLGLSASFYFDYRAISNYTDVVVEKIKAQKIKDGHDTDGVMVQTVDNSVTMMETSMKMYQNSLIATEKRLTDIAESRSAIDASIERVKTKKESIKSQREISKLNQNIYTSRKQLEGLDEQENRVHAQQAELREELSKIQAKIEAKAKEKGAILEGVDSKMDEDQFQRLLFLFVLVIFIEVTSFGGLLADFLGNKNLEASLKEDLDRLNNNTDAMSVLRSHLTRMEVRQARDFDRELAMRGAVSDVHALSSIANMHRQAQNIKSLTGATNKIGEATQEVTTMAVEGIASSIRADLSNRKVAKLQELLEHGTKEISENIVIENHINSESTTTGLAEACRKAGIKLKKDIEKYKLFEDLTKEDARNYEREIRDAIQGVAQDFPNSDYKTIQLEVFRYADIQPA